MLLQAPREGKPQVVAARTWLGGVVVTGQRSQPAGIRRIKRSPSLFTNPAVGFRLKNSGCAMKLPSPFGKLFSIGGFAGKIQKHSAERARGQIGAAAGLASPSEVQIKP